MNKNTMIFAIGFIPLILLIALIIVVINQQTKSSNDFDQNLNHLYNGSEEVQASPTTTVTTTTDNSDEDTVRMFFEYLDKDEIGLALNLLSTKLVGEEPPQLNSILQAYGVTFSHFEKVEVISINRLTEESNKENPMFEVQINIQFKPNAEELIWDQGQNTRFITLGKSEGSWKIESIATSI